jgi:hypothetical protein
MYDRRKDYMRRRADKRRYSGDARGTSDIHGYTQTGLHNVYGPDHARRRYDAAMDRARRRRGRPRDRMQSQSDGHYSVGHYLYEDPQHSQYVPTLDFAAHDQEYEQDLNEWIERMKHHDKFKLGKHDVAHKAREMHINFDEFTEEELYAAYLLHHKLYPNMHDQPHMYIACAKAWLCEEGIAVDPSEKICKYLYEIVLDD